MAELKRIAICDDEIGTCSDLEKIVLDFADRRALQIETEVFYSGEAFYRSIQEQTWIPSMYLSVMGMASLIKKMDCEEVRPM